jgi:hypothetical protein
MLFARDSEIIDDSRHGPRKRARMAREAAVGVRRNKLVIAGAILFLPFLGGCAGTIDTLTSQRFREHPFHTLFGSDDPVWVLENVPEGDQRAKAMSAVKEPKRHGGKDEEQKRVMELIAASATSDKQVVCRLGAIETLARFDDPQSSKILVAAYHNATIEAPKDNEPAGVVQAGRRVRQPFAPVSSFTSDQVVMIQSKALEALGKKRSPEGLALLCEIAATPAKKEAKPAEFDPLAQGDLGQDSSDLRLAAIRALAHFKNDIHAAQLLYRIMTTERGDVALKSRAYESLQKVTGKDYPPTSPDWKLVVQVKESAAAPPSFRNTNQPPLLSEDRLNGTIAP